VLQEIWQYEWGQEIVRENPNATDMLENEENKPGQDNHTTKRVVNFFSLTANAIASLFLVIVIAIYVAAEPGVYTKGFIRLFSMKRRARVAEILDQIALTIQWWIVGQLTSMIILGLITTLGLWLLGVPYYLLLGILTALMTFIPNIGPIIAAIPTILVALTVGVDTAFYVTIFYLVVQNIEGYFITPMIHRKAIQVPPILIIAAQFVLYSLIGFIGVLIAMPLVACVVVIVQMVYIEDILGDSMDRDLEYDYTSKNIF
jgi:predicted PurR-regulated permease PerM